MAAAFLLGQFSVHTGPVLVPAGIAAASFALLLSSAAYPKVQKHSQRTDGAAGENDGVAQSETPPAASRSRTEAEGSIFSFFTRYPQYAVALVGLLPIFIGHIYINNYLLQIVRSKGAGSSSMGNLMSVAALLELTVMLIYGKLRTWRPDSFWFRISGIFFTLKVLLTLLAPTIGFLYPVQLIQPLGWGLLSVSSVYYISEAMAPSDGWFPSGSRRRLCHAAVRIDCLRHRRRAASALRQAPGKRRKDMIQSRAKPRRQSQTLSIHPEKPPLTTRNPSRPDSRTRSASSECRSTSRAFAISL